VPSITLVALSVRLICIRVEIFCCWHLNEQRSFLMLSNACLSLPFHSNLATSEGSSYTKMKIPRPFEIETTKYVNYVSLRYPILNYIPKIITDQVCLSSCISDLYSGH
jgi:hypothetical protein